MACKFFSYQSFKNVYVHLTLYYTIPTFNGLKKEAFWNIVGKGENAGYQHNVFYPFHIKFQFLSHI